MTSQFLKRPLAFFGGVYFLLTLAAVSLPAVALLPLALLCVAVFLFVFLYYRFKKVETKKPDGFKVAFVILLAAALGLLSSFVFNAAKMKPLEKLSGENFAVTAQVVGEEHAYGYETSNVTLKILQVENNPQIAPFNVRLQNFAEVSIGDIITLELDFYTLKGSTQQYNFAKSVYIGARAASAPDIVGQKIDFICFVRLLQKSAVQNIMRRLPYGTGAVTAAMAVGSDEYLQTQTVLLYRNSGLSHMLNVSGMHFSILCTLLYQVVSKLIKKRKLANSLCILFVLCFAVFTGLVPSVVRSALMYIIVFSAGFFNRKQDTATSLGFAAFAIALINPFAVLDTGVWLSFTATVGVLFGGYFCKKYPVRIKKEPFVQGIKFIYTAASISFFASFFTLPVLLISGFGISPGSIPLNMLALPFAEITVPLGLLLALPIGFAPLDYILRAVALLEASCIKALDFIASLGIYFGGAIFTGALIAAALIIIVPLAVLGVSKDKLGTAALMCCVLLVFSVFLQFVFEKELVRIDVAGSGENASLVITQNGKSVVLYKSARSIVQIDSALQKANSRECVLLIDMRATTQSTRHTQFLSPTKTLEAQSEVAYKTLLEPLPNVKIFLLRQAGGLFACVQAGDYTVGIYTGKINVSYYMHIDLLLASRGQAKGNFGKILVGETVPVWAQNNANLCYNKGQAAVLVRLFAGYKLREIQFI